MNYTATTVSGQSVRASFGFAEGAERVTAFWRENGKHFCQLTNELNPHA